MTATIEEREVVDDFDFDLDASIPCDIQVKADEPCGQAAEWRAIWDASRLCACAQSMNLICDHHREILLDPDTAVSCAACGYMWRPYRILLNLDRL